MGADEAFDRASSPASAPTCAVFLSAIDVDALLYALDDADGLFMGGAAADAMLATWQRLNIERHDGTPPFSLTAAEAANLRHLCSADWLATVKPRVLRNRVAAIINRCRAAGRIPERAST